MDRDADTTSTKQPPLAPVSSMTVPQEVVDALEAMRRPAVIGHVVPDTDCLGSMLATARTWPDSDGRPGRVCLPPGCVSHRLQFMVDMAQVPVVGPEGLADADGFVVVDAATLDRCNLGSAKQADWDRTRPVVNIDHHQTNTRFGSINWVVPEASSAAELVYHVIRAANRTVDPVTASLLFAGLHADTRGFTAAGITGASLTVAAALVDAGAATGEIGERLYRSRQPGEFKLLRVIYTNTHLSAGGRIAYSTADHDEISACGCTAADIDEQVEVPRSLEGTSIAILFTEGVPGTVRINFRGKGSVSVLALAGAVGGGGHQQAAGAVLKCTISQALERVLPLAQKHLDLQQPERPAADSTAMAGEPIDRVG